MQVVKAILSLFLSLFGLIKPAKVETEFQSRSKRVIGSSINGYEYDTHFTIDKILTKVTYSQSWIPDCQYVTALVKNRLRRNRIDDSSVYHNTHNGLFMMLDFKSRVFAALPWWLFSAIVFGSARPQLGVLRILLRIRTWIYEQCYKYIEWYDADKQK